MSSESTIQKRWDTGYPTFKKLFDMPYKDLKEILKRILSSHSDDVEYTINEGKVFKEYENDEPHKLGVYCYGSVTISPFGIDYKPEHGPGRTLVEFNEFFKL